MGTMSSENIHNGRTKKQVLKSLRKMNQKSLHKGTYLNLSKSTGLLLGMRFATTTHPAPCPPGRRDQRLSLVNTYPFSCSTGLKISHSITETLQASYTRTPTTPTNRGDGLNSHLSCNTVPINCHVLAVGMGNRGTETRQSAR